MPFPAPLRPFAPAPLWGTQGAKVSEWKRQTFTTLGFGDIFDQLLDGLTNSIDGAVSIADDAFQDQIEFTQSRIDDFDDRLDVKRLRLEREFAAMETALARLQGQNAALLSLSSSLSLAQSFIS